MYTQFQTVMKLKFKKDRISDVQRALDGSTDLEFRDFRETLKEYVIFIYFFINLSTGQA